MKEASKKQYSISISFTKPKFWERKLVDKIEKILIDSVHCLRYFNSLLPNMNILIIYSFNLNAHTIH